MMDSADLISLEVEVRDLIGEETAKFWTQAKAFRAINDEMSRLARRIIALDKGYFEVVVTPTPAASYVLPRNCILVRNVELYVDNGWMQPRWISDHTRGHYQTIGAGYPWAVRVQDNTLYFENGIGSASQMRVNYTRMPADMVYATLASGSATTAVFAAGSVSVLDDVYIGDTIKVLSGTGVYQISTATDYVASTRTLTIPSGATLDNTSVVSWLLPEPLNKFSDIVVAGAAMRLLMRRRDDNLYKMIQENYDRDVADMMDVLAQRQTVGAEHGNYQPNGDD